MKTIEIENEQRPLAEILPSEASEEVIYLTRGGRTRFVVVPFDEGDEEVLTIRKNKMLMDYIAESADRGQKGPTKSLGQLRTELGTEQADTKQ